MNCEASNSVYTRYSARHTWRYLIALPGLLLRSNSAAIAPMMALLLLPIAGSIAYSVELGSWYYFQRSMQNAADGAAIAAATNNRTTGSTYLAEARAAAKSFGFVDGQRDTTVNAKIVSCPGLMPAPCYSVTISTVLPLIFSQVLGFNGSSNLQTGRGQQVSAEAIAGPYAGTGFAVDLCYVGLSSAGITSNGGRVPQRSECSIMSNGSLTCIGNDLGARYGIAVGTNSGCGQFQVSNARRFVDNVYPQNAASIPPSPCKNSYALSKMSGLQNFAAPLYFCGDVKLTGNVTVPSNANAVVVIENGSLDLGGFTFKTASGAAATIVFTGTNSPLYSHFPTGSGTLDIVAPRSGPWSGVAIYQNPALTQNVSFADQPTQLNLRGLLYIPNADYTFKTGFSENAQGESCFLIIANNILINSTQSIFPANPGCAALGLTQPSGLLPRAKLVK